MAISILRRLIVFARSNPRGHTHKFSMWGRSDISLYFITKNFQLLSLSTQKIPFFKHTGKNSSLFLYRQNVLFIFWKAIKNANFNFGFTELSQISYNITQAVNCNYVQINLSWWKIEYLCLFLRPTTPFIPKKFYLEDYKSTCKLLYLWS